jgi:hypothetical protein
MELKELEMLLVTHLQESGEIREGVKEVKRGLDTLSTRLWAIALICVSTMLAVVGFLLKVSLWK